MYRASEKLNSFLENSGISSFSFAKEENNMYNFGDIVRAKRYKNGREKKKISVGQREGLYLVLQGNGDTFICFCGTGECPSYDDLSSYFVLNSKISGFPEKIYFSYRDIKILKDFLVLSQMGELNNEAKEEVKANVESILFHGKIYKEIREEIDQFPLIPGDIFTEEGKDYLFLKEENNSVFLLPLKEEGNLQISFSNRIAFVSYDSLLPCEKKKTYHRIGYISDSLVAFIRDKVAINLSAERQIYKREPLKKHSFVLHEQNKPDRMDALEDVATDVDLAMENFGYLGAVVSFKVDQREYIVLLKEGDFFVLLDKEKYIEGEYYLQTASLKEIKKLCYLTKKSFLDVLHSLQDKYSSYLHSGYIRNLAKIYETS